MRRMAMLIMAVVMLLSATAWAEGERDSVLKEGTYADVLVQYDAGRDETLYTLTLKDNAQMTNGAPVSAADVLFTYYYHLDPSRSGESWLAEYPIAGLDSYLSQISQERLDAALGAIAAMEAAGRDYVPTLNDGWTVEQQEAFWALKDDYQEACAREYPLCAQAIVEYWSAENAANGMRVFGKSPEEIAGSEGLQIAYAMVQSGLAFTDAENKLTTFQSRVVWELGSGILPTMDEFIREMKLVYGDELSRCWEILGTSNYEPELPEAKTSVMAMLLGEEKDTVRAISGIRMTDDRTVEVVLKGQDMDQASALFSIQMLSRETYGDASMWNPQEGLYGHPYGDTTAVENALNTKERVFAEVMNYELSF